jgi:hypothetical protein
VDLADVHELIAVTIERKSPAANSGTVPGQALRMDACDRAIVLATLYTWASTYVHKHIGVLCSYSTSGEVARYRDKHADSSALRTESPHKASNSIRQQ